MLSGAKARASWIYCTTGALAENPGPARHRGIELARRDQAATELGWRDQAATELGWRGTGD